MVLGGPLANIIPFAVFGYCNLVRNYNDKLSDVAPGEGA